jgi:DNA-directed RNA polymerase specialized sigma24 family protein
MQMWQSQNMELYDKIFIFLQTEHKENWFRRVIFKHSKISDEIMRELAEDAFLTTWLAFNKSGNAGKIQLTEHTYLGYFFRSFKNNYLKLLATQARQTNAELDYGRGQPHFEANDAALRELNVFSEQTIKVMAQMTPESKELLIWRHVEGISYDEIAEKRRISRSSAIKMVSRYGKQFLKLWQENRQSETE